jgi:hypothetical protein
MRRTRPIKQKPGVVSHPGANREFQFPYSAESGASSSPRRWSLVAQIGRQEFESPVARHFGIRYWRQTPPILRFELCETIRGNR